MSESIEIFIEKNTLFFKSLLVRVLIYKLKHYLNHTIDYSIYIRNVMLEVLHKTCIFYLNFLNYIHRFLKFILCLVHSVGEVYIYIYI